MMDCTFYISAQGARAPLRFWLGPVQPSAQDYMITVGVALSAPGEPLHTRAHNIYGASPIQALSLAMRNLCLEVILRCGPDAILFFDAEHTRDERGLALNEVFDPAIFEAVMREHIRNEGDGAA